MKGFGAFSLPIAGGFLTGGSVIAGTSVVELAGGAAQVRVRFGGGVPFIPFIPSFAIERIPSYVWKHPATNKPKLQKPKI